MDAYNREAMSYMASTGGITAQNIRDLLLVAQSIVLGVQGSQSNPVAD